MTKSIIIKHKARKAPSGSLKGGEAQRTQDVNGVIAGNDPQSPVRRFALGDSCFRRNRRQVERNRACSNCRDAKEEDKVNDGVTLCALCIFFALFAVKLTAQPPQRPAAPPSEPPRVNSVYLGVAGGLSVPFSFIANSQLAGGFGQAEIFVFLTERITVGTDFAYHYFPGKDKYHDVAMQEVLINGAFYFNYSWNPHISLGLGYYGEPGASHFGMVPGIGIMPKITDNIFFTTRASIAFFDMDGHFFKVGAGIVFMVYRHKPIRKF